MKKKVFFSAVVVAGLLLQSCEYDDQKLWDSVNEMEDRIETLESSITTANTNIATLQQLVSTLQSAVTITSVTPIENGYEIYFSNGNKAQIINGTDGTNGTNGTNGINAPAISVTEQEGSLYWTLDGDLMLYNGLPVKASATDAIAPQIRINETSKEWETSVDNGQTWVSTGVVAQGKPGASGDSFFTDVDVSNSEYITFILHDSTEIKVARYDDNAPSIEFDGSTTISLEYGQSVTLNAIEKNVAQYAIAKPDGWRVKYENGTMTITAPDAENSYAEKGGVISITLVSESNKSVIVNLNVSAYELRTLTFEDADTKFTPYTLDYVGKDINSWNDLIAVDQYMDLLIYDMSGVAPYRWCDENNTELTHAFPYNYNSYAFWGGGHAVSNYASRDIERYGDYMNQLTVYGDEGSGGHNGSANFCIHYGYIDGSSYNGTEELSTISFNDGVARVIDHMWINNTNYCLNCFTNGNNLTATLGPNDKAWIVATGYNENDEIVGNSIFYLANGPENIITEWTKWDLSELGAVVKIEFNTLGSSDNGFGYSQPAYFAYDDVAVRF